MFLEWSDIKKYSKLIKLGKVSSMSHLGQGLSGHLRSYFIHGMARPITFYFNQLDIGKLKSTSEWEALQIAPQQ
jgi:hypothetical protein